ncbi:hypothetical protein MmTuc01_1526 [Methanosarcina mazei Tuc01]|uniref:Uncharacterized protein n=1 Tax=Methanosarcina mazei Tuc01 TaxID=1236903 RepID=M1P8V8_METMZ|nr:hypothetical protein MmTuc01_1526 [Methanosarcina mazei Tuc01]
MEKASTQGFIKIITFQENQINGTKARKYVQKRKAALIY